MKYVEHLQFYNALLNIILNFRVKMKKAFQRPTCMSWSPECLLISGQFRIRKMKVFINA